MDFFRQTGLFSTVLTAAAVYEYTLPVRIGKTHEQDRVVVRTSAERGESRRESRGVIIFQGGATARTTGFDSHGTGAA